MKRFSGLLALLLGAACTDDRGAKTEEPAAESPVSNRIDVPPAVRRNLGITFVEVERRHVASTIRVPGRFELLPTAHREYHVTLPGRVELLVDQYDEVEAGTPLYRVDSPAWREMQQKLSDAIVAIRKADARRKAILGKAKAIEKHHARARHEERVWEERLAQVEALIAAGSGAASERTEARSRLAAAHTSLAKVEEERAEVAQARIEVEADLAAHRQATPLLHADALEVPAEEGQQVDLAFAPAAAMLGTTVEALRRDTGGGVPYWRTIDRVEAAAREPGIVEALPVTNGGWVNASDLVMTTVDPSRIRFRAVGLQADLGRLEDGMPVRIVPPRGGVQSLRGSLQGALTIGLWADALERKIDLLVVPEGGDRPAWARRGISAEMEIVLDRTAEAQLAIPVTAVIQDGLQKVLFRRDPRDPDKVIRLEADLGLGDGRWVVVQSGVTDGDEVVHHGVYELMLASGSAAQKGGHFHADGTYHEESHD